MNKKTVGTYVLSKSLESMLSIPMIFEKNVMSIQVLYVVRTSLNTILFIIELKHTNIPFTIVVNNLKKNTFVLISYKKYIVIRYVYKKYFTRLWL